MLRTAVFTLAAGLLVGCTTVAPIQRPAGEPQEYVVACGSGSGWNICYNKANKLCPQGYKTTRDSLLGEHPRAPDQGCIEVKTQVIQIPATA